MIHTVPHHLQVQYIRYVPTTYGHLWVKCKIYLHGTVCIYNFTSYSTLHGTTTYSPSYLYLPSLHFIDGCSTHIPNHDAFGYHTYTDKKSASASKHQYLTLSTPNIITDTNKLCRLNSTLGLTLGLLPETREVKVLVSRATTSTARHVPPNLSCKLEAIATVIHSYHHYFYFYAYQSLDFTAQCCIDCGIASCLKLVTVTV